MSLTNTLSETEPHTLSQRGINLVKSFEGYHTRQADGSCVAYLDRLARPMIWTIGYGLTEGVYKGMHLSEAAAEAGLRRELGRHEKAVIRLVTVPLTQPQFDALVSFSYNVGSGALRRSTLLRKLNRGDYRGAQGSFAAWRMAGGKVYRGLVRRRKAEADLFGADPIVLAAPSDPIPPLPVPDMPQIIDEVTEKETKKELAAKSRKYRTAAATQNAIAAGGGAWGVWESSKLYMGEASTGIAMVKGLLSQVGWVAVLGAGLLAYVIFGYLKTLMVEDAKEGKYLVEDDGESE